jgi:hypothetical protein
MGGFSLLEHQHPDEMHQDARLRYRADFGCPTVAPPRRRGLRGGSRRGDPLRAGRGHGARQVSRGASAAHHPADGGRAGHVVPLSGDEHGERRLSRRAHAALSPLPPSSASRRSGPLTRSLAHGSCRGDAAVVDSGIADIARGGRHLPFRCLGHRPCAGETGAGRGRRRHPHWPSRRRSGSGAGFRHPGLVAPWPLVWNGLGLLDILHTLFRAVASAPGPQRLFFEEPANRIPAVFPFVYLPGFIVPLTILLHLLSLRQLRVTTATR